MAWALAGLVAAAAATVVGGSFGLAMWRRRWLIADLPTSDAAHVFVGMNEVVGRAVPVERPIVAPYSAVECVWYRSLLEREEKNQNDQSSWKTEADESSEVPFWIEDDTGRVLIRPKGASIYATERVRDVHPGRPGRHSGLSLLRTLAGGSSDSFPSIGSARYRSTEWVLRPDEPIYLLGDATLRSDTVALEFAPDDPSTIVRRSLLLSAGDERRVARRTGWQGLALLLLLMAGAAGLAAAWHGVTTARDGGPLAGDPSTIEATRGAMTVAAALVLAALPVLYVGRLFNRLVAARNRVEAAWSLIDVQLRKRHDLIPRLVDVVEAAAAHERTLLESVTALRSGASLPDATRLPDVDVLEQVAEIDEAERTRSRSLIALAEKYPELRTNENFIALGEQIIAVENGVAFARTFYNDALTVMRDQRQRFPGLLLAPLVPVPSMGLFESDQPDARPAETAEAPADLRES